MANENSITWKGVHLSTFKHSFNSPQYPAVVNKDDHTVLVQTPIIPGKVPDSFPSVYDRVDFWDSTHIKLPCSEKNVTEDQISRWALIKETLNSVILSSQQLEAAILSYNKRFAERWNFATLRMFFDEVCDEEESAAFFQTLLPKMIDLALCLPELVTGGIPVLKHGRTHSITLSQMQIASLLANAFFITFPRRNSYAKGCEYANYPTINFTRLFQAVFRDRKKATLEKIKCILHYFRRVTASPPTGVVTFSRHFVSKLVLPDWAKSTRMLPKLYVSSTGTIEDEGFGLLQVDFAHKLVGGGVIANGCVQEEIRFVICPELIISRLFTECLEDNEAFIVTGCERFSKYKGYGKSFEWDGNYVDVTPSDEEGRKYCSVVAIDALYFRKNFAKEQYSIPKMNRELNKAYAGFSWGTRRKNEELCGIASGNWGCGVYRGNPEFKSFLQMMAAAESNRSLAYFTFGNEELRDSMHAIHEFLINNKVTIGKIYNILCQYNANQLYDRVSVYDYLKKEAISSNKSSYKVTENSDNVAINMVKPFGFSPVTKRSFCYSSKKMANDGNNSSQTQCKSDDRTISDDELPSSSNQEVDGETKKMKSRECEELVNFYKLPPPTSTSTANISEDSDDSFDLDKYRQVKRVRCSDENTDSESVDENKPQSPSVNKSEEETQCQVSNESFDDTKQMVCDSEEETEQNENDTESQTENDEDHEDVKTGIPRDENVQDSCIKESGDGVNVDSAENIPKSYVKTFTRSRSVPLKGLKFISKKNKSNSNSSKKKFLDQKTKINHYFSSLQN